MVLDSYDFFSTGEVALNQSISERPSQRREIVNGLAALGLCGSLVMSFTHVAVAATTGESHHPKHCSSREDRGAEEIAYFPLTLRLVHISMAGVRLRHTSGKEPLPGYPFDLDIAKAARSLDKDSAFKKWLSRQGIDTTAYVKSVLSILLATKGADHLPSCIPTSGVISKNQMLLRQLSVKDQAFVRSW